MEHTSKEKLQLPHKAAPIRSTMLNLAVETTQNALTIRAPLIQKETLRLFQPSNGIRVPYYFHMYINSKHISRHIILNRWEIPSSYSRSQLFLTEYGKKKNNKYYTAKEFFTTTH